MINITSDSGHINLFGLTLHWFNQDDAFDFPGYFCIGYNNYSLEFGEIDMGNGIYLVEYADGDVNLLKTFVEFAQ